MGEPHLTHAGECLEPLREQPHKFNLMRPSGSARGA
jgi:hypothetical protein